MNPANPLFNRRQGLLTLGALAVTPWSREASAQSYQSMRIAPGDVHIAVQPMGPFAQDLYSQIEQGLTVELGVHVEQRQSIELPSAAYYAPRRRYRAERLLDHLRPMVVAPINRILGVTEVDISTTAHGTYDWGILGLGEMPGQTCVISLFRCRRNARDLAQRNFRMVTTCIHEVGHTLGLEHCADTQCLMTDARGRVATIDRCSGHLCARCRRRLGLPPRP